MSAQPTRSTDQPLQRTTFDPTAPGAATAAVVDSLAAVSGTSRLELPPLYEIINLETTARLVRHAATRTPESVVRLEFTVDAWTICVSSEGEVSVYALDSTTAPEGRTDEASR